MDKGRGRDICLALCDRTTQQENRRLKLVCTVRFGSYKLQLGASSIPRSEFLRLLSSARDVSTKCDPQIPRTAVQLLLGPIEGRGQPNGELASATKGSGKVEAEVTTYRKPGQILNEDRLPDRHADKCKHLETASSRTPLATTAQTGDSMQTGNSRSRQAHAGHRRRRSMQGMLGSPTRPGIRLGSSHEAAPPPTGGNALSAITAVRVR